VKRKLAAGLILLVILGLVLPGQALAEFSVPTGFDDQPVANGVPLPTAIDWLPGNDLLIASKEGVLFRQSGSDPAQPILNLSGAVCSTGEMGLLGLAVDPAFSANRFIYLYYTHKQGGGGCDAANRANRVSRFTLDSNGVPVGETVLIDNIAAPGSNHNAGDLQFDRQGLLYISVGDGGSTPDTARRLDTLNGKILRIDRNGGIPVDNPFQGPGTMRCAASGGETVVNDPGKKKKKKKRKHKKHSHGKHKHKKQKRRKDRRKKQNDSTPTTVCQEIYATGLRNPFRIAFDSNDLTGPQQFYINDVGGGAWEEIDAGAPGADYGWDIREGPCVRGSTTNCPQPSGFVEPIFAYPHSTGCRTITGGAFVPAGEGWGIYEGVYFYADFTCGKIFALRDETPGQIPDEFADGTDATHLAFGPDGDLYYATFESDGVVPGGQVRRIVPLP
jgi:glucose/arabinose dehydrogenase